MGSHVYTKEEMMDFNALLDMPAMPRSNILHWLLLESPDSVRQSTKYSIMNILKRSNHATVLSKLIR